MVRVASVRPGMRDWFMCVCVRKCARARACCERVWGRDLLHGGLLSRLLFLLFGLRARVGRGCVDAGYVCLGSRSCTYAGLGASGYGTWMRRVQASTGPVRVRVRERVHMCACAYEV